MALPITLNQQNAGGHHTFLASSRAKLFEIARNAKKIGEEDPRKIVHSVKAAVAVTLVSLLYYIDPLYTSFGVNTTWALISVVVVFEFSVGATIGRGISRMLATLVAGSLGLGAYSLATVTAGNIFEPIVINIFLFAIVGIASYARFFPKLKARFDYGLLIFILTFSLISVSGYREESLRKMAVERLTTIMAGSCVAILVNISIFPVWIGHDLHNLVVANLEKLAVFLQGFGGEDGDAPNKDKSLQGYMSVLSSQSSIENMANLARWEPGHGRFKFRHPWKQYLIVGTLSRKCAIKIDALNMCINPQIQTSVEICREIQEQCTKISLECGKALNQTSLAMKKMIRNESARPHIENSKAAVENLKSLLKVGFREEEAACLQLLEISSVTAVASLMLEIVESTEKIVNGVHELGCLADFKQKHDQEQELSTRMHDVDVHAHEIAINGGE